MESGKRGNDEVHYYDESLKFQSGNAKDYNDFLFKEIVPFKATRLAMTIGLASVVMGYIEPSLSLGSPIINVCGPSSTGKSTVAELAASFFASPDLSINGLVRGFNSTPKHLITGTEGRFGLPIIFDDANANNGEHNKIHLIYQLSQNASRGRCKSDGTPQRGRLGWSGDVIITSESPLVDSTEATNQGVKARIHTLYNVPWTNDAGHSERIKNGVRTNYGFFGLQFAQWVIQTYKNGFKSAFDEAYEAMLQRIDRSIPTADRVAMKLAPIYMTSKILHDNFSDSFNPDEISDLLFAYPDDDSTTIEDIVYNDFLDYISLHRKDFISSVGSVFRDATNSISGGIFIADGSDSRLYVNSAYFDRFLEEEECDERRYILSKWRDSGKILVDGNHFKVKCRALGNIRAYCFKFDTEDIFIIRNQGEVFADDPAYVKKHIDEFRSISMSKDISQTPKCIQYIDDADQIDAIFKGE